MATTPTAHNAAVEGQIAKITDARDGAQSFLQISTWKER